eukprot:GSChrysophyteH1.ASY1.ANO1.840.1 assembled CDS
MDDSEPSVKALSTAGGYSQIYVIHSPEKEAKDADPGDTREVLFRCGNWAYRGKIQFNGLKISTPELPVLIPILQKQQGSLRYFCNAATVPETSDYYRPLEFLADAVDFFATEMIQESLQNELRDMANKFPWIDDEGSATYFEMELSNIPSFMSAISLMAAKTYTRGLIIITVYSEEKLFFVVQGGEGDQALLDVRFPDISKHGEGMQLAAYNDHSVCYRKLTLWHAVQKTIPVSLLKELPKLKTINVTSKSYQQTYCIMRSSWDNNSSVLSVHHDVLFRFGSWCYAGRVQLTSTLALADIPLIIPALRMQQSRLDFLCDTSSVPVTSPFAGALDYCNRTAPLVENQIQQCEILLDNIIEQTKRDDPSEAEALETWLEGDPSESFFELNVLPDTVDKKDLSNIELIASKTYHASGVVTLAIYFENTIYVIVQDADKENPLLDSRFPDVSNKGRGFQIQAFGDEGADQWPALRKTSLWQNKNATNRDHLARLASREADAKDSSDREISMKGVARSLEDDPHFRDDGDDWAIGTDLDSNSDAKKTAVTIEDASSTDGEAGVISNKAEAKGSSSRPSKSAASKDGRSVDTSLGAAHNPTEASPTTLVDRAPRNPTDLAADGSPTSAASGKPMFSQPLSDLRNADSKGSPSGGGNIDFAKSNSTLKAARPHHLPKMQGLGDGLSKQMESLRRELTEEGLTELGAAPWEAGGKPLEKKKKKKKRSEDKEGGSQAKGDA